MSWLLLRLISNQFHIHVFVYMRNNHCHRVTAQLQLINIIIIIIINFLHEKNNVMLSTASNTII